MADILDHGRFQVALRLSARRPVTDHEAEALCALLGSEPWPDARVAVVVLPDAESVDVQATLTARDATGAATEVLDRVRRLAGLDAHFARWTVHARQLRVQTLPR